MLKFLTFNPVVLSLTISNATFRLRFFELRMFVIEHVLFNFVAFFAQRVFGLCFVTAACPDPEVIKNHAQLS